MTSHGTERRTTFSSHVTISNVVSHLNKILDRDESDAHAQNLVKNAEIRARSDITITYLSSTDISHDNPSVFTVQFQNKDNKWKARSN